MKYRWISHGLSLLLLVIPIHVYLIGDGIGVGIQSAILNYKSTYLGDSLTHAFIELNYVLSGLITGKTAYSILLWFAGFLLLLIALLSIILAGYHEEVRDRRSGYLYLAAGLCFLVSIFIQYGIWFVGPAGISIPIGIPLILYFGWWYHTSQMKKSESSADEVEHSDEQ
jgi:hypothetical protein